MTHHKSLRHEVKVNASVHFFTPVPVLKTQQKEYVRDTYCVHDSVLHSQQSRV